MSISLAARFKHNLAIFIAIIVLSVMGIVTLLSTNIDISGEISFGGIVAKQLLFMLLGLAIYATISYFDYSYLKHLQIVSVIYLSVLMLLLITKLFGPTINGVQRWLIIFGTQIQPSEIAKVVVIITTASTFSLKDRYNEWLLAAVSGLLLLPILVLIYIEPHGSMSFIIFTMWFLMVFTFLSNQVRNGILLAITAFSTLGIILLTLKMFLLGGIMLVLAFILFALGMYSREKWRKFFMAALLIGVLAGLIGSVTWNKILRDYQRQRIESFFKDETEQCDSCFNVDQSKVAIGSGGLLGKGFGYGTQSRLKFLPEHQTDFIFATFAEQFGMVGSLFLLGVYLFLILRILILGMKQKANLFASVLAVGIGIKLLLEVFVNIGANMGVIPVTGSPLPLMSAGGSITLMTFFSMGLIQSIIGHHSTNLEVKDFIDKEDLLI